MPAKLATGIAYVNCLLAEGKSSSAPCLEGVVPPQ